MIAAGCLGLLFGFLLGLAAGHILARPRFPRLLPTTVTPYMTVSKKIQRPDPEPDDDEAPAPCAYPTHGEDCTRPLGCGDSGCGYCYGEPLPEVVAWCDARAKAKAVP